MAVNPDDFIISRKRKKYKFALFANSPHCFEVDKWGASWDPDVVEIGAGTGLFSVELATRHPDQRFVALDIKADRLQKGAREADNRKLTNIRFLRARADQMDGLFKPSTVRQLWLTFPDPHPKKRSAGRRLTHPAFLHLYATLLGPEGNLLVKHDSPEFFQWSLEQLVVTGWHITELSFDLYQSTLADDYKIMTVYEQRWLEEGRSIQFARAAPDSRVGKFAA